MENEHTTSPTGPEKSTSGDDIVASANVMFGLYYPRFCALVSKLSGKSARRLTKALNAQPLEGMNYKPVSNDEKEAYNIGMKLQEARTILLVHTFSTAVDKSVEQTNGENENGEKQV